MRADTSYSIYHMRRVVRRPVVYLFLFFYLFFFLHGEAEISGLWLSSVTAQPGLCRAWSEAMKTGILTTRLIYFNAKKKMIKM